MLAKVLMVLAAVVEWIIEQTKTDRHFGNLEILDSLVSLSFGVSELLFLPRFIIMRALLLWRLF